MVVELGGPSDLIERPDRHLRRAPIVRAVEAPEPGIVTATDVRALGLAVIDLGGGRARDTDVVDHSVGLTAAAGLGERVAPGSRPLALVHARDGSAADRAAQAICAAYTLGDSPPTVTDPVVEVQRAV